MMRLAETLASGENIKSSDVRSVFSSFLGDATNEQWAALTEAIINKNYEDFKEAVKAIKPTIKDD